MKPTGSTVSDQKTPLSAVAEFTEQEAAEYLDEGFSVKVLNMAPADGYNQGKSYWRCPHCGMADFDGHEQSCIIRTLVERLLGKHIPFGKIDRTPRSATPRSWKEQDADMLAAAVDKAIRAGTLDARSEIADCRLDYGQPFTPEEVERHLAKRRHGKNAAADSALGAKP